jgi:hypothetical protein
MGKQVITGEYLLVFRRKLQVEVADSSKMLVNMYETTWQHLQEDGNPHSHQWESHMGR